jgi:hypothetical protein
VQLGALNPEFINFQHIVVWEYLFTCILGILCFAATLRILSALSYNKRLTEVALVLQKGAYLNTHITVPV